MEDSVIVDLYFQRSETAISQTSTKYGKYCRQIAYNILQNNEDSEECVNDTYLKAWNSIPPAIPKNLAAFLGRITRNISLDKYRQYSSKKRCKGQMHLVLDELAECIPSGETVDSMIDEMLIVDVLNDFLGALTEENRKIFMHRYFYVCSIRDISKKYRISESKVKMSLLRSRNQLKELLEKEGVACE